MGLIVISGWYAKLSILVQVHRNFAPMQFNTALCLLFTGTGLLLTAINKERRASLLLFCLTGSIGIATLLEYGLQIDLGIDQLFVHHFITTKTSHPGRMAPNSAVCFVVIALFGSLFARRLRTAFEKQLAILLVSLLGGLSLLSILGYLFNLQTAYLWGHLTGMAVHTSSSLFLLAIGSISLWFTQSNGTHKFSWVQLEIPIFVFLITVSVFLKFALDDKEESRNAILHHERAEALSKALQTYLFSTTKAVARIASRWEVAGGTPRAVWEADATHYVEDIPALQAVKWIDSRARLRWRVPLDKTRMGQELNTDPVRAKALRTAETHKTITLTDAISIENGARGWMVNVPIYVNGRFDGFISALFNMEHFLRDFENASGFQGYEISLKEEGVLLSEGVKNPSSANTEMSTFSFFNKRFSISLTPKESLVQEYSSHLQEFALLFGLLVSLLFLIIAQVQKRNEALLAEIQKDRQFLDTVVEKTPSPLIFVNRNQEIVRFNQAASALFEYTSKEILHKDVNLLVPDSMRISHPQKIEAFFGNLTSRQMSERTNIVGKTKSGTLVPVNIALTPVSYKGEPLVLAGISDLRTYKKNEEKILRQAEFLQKSQQATLNMMRDARDAEKEAVRAKQELERYASLLERQNTLFEIVFEGISDGIAVANEKGEFTIFNKAAEEILGIGMAKSSPGKWAEHFSVLWIDKDEPFPTEQLPLIRALHGELVDNQLLRIRNPKKGIIFIEVSARPLFAGSQSFGGVAIFKDVTERAISDREKEILTQELRRSNAELEQFAYVASHDLQAPLRAISSYVEILASELDFTSNPDHQQWMKFIQEGAEEMKGLIRDLLTLSRVGKDGKRIEVNLHDIVEKLKSTVFQTQAGSIHIEGTLPKIVAVETSLRQLFQNLISNALKFTRKDTPQEVILKAEEKADHWLFSVKDNGIGIKAEHRVKIFGVFQRLHTDDQFEGSGIGLSICEKVVKQHGGNIWVESDGKNGTTFLFSLRKRNLHETDPPLEMRPPIAVGQR